MRVSDRQIVEAVKLYRLHPDVANLHGPQNLDELGHFLAHLYHDIDGPISKAVLSLRLEKLVSQGLLAARKSSPFVPNEPNFDRLFTPSLHVTAMGEDFLEKTNGDGV
jgi:DNA-binding HxlR family transcriptional regulator